MLHSQPNLNIQYSKQEQKNIQSKNLIMNLMKKLQKLH